MKHRYLVLAILGACLLASFSSASLAESSAPGASPDIEVTQQALSTYQNGLTAQITVSFELTNTGESPLRLWGCRVELMDREGQVLLYDDEHKLSPNVLLPGGKAFGSASFYPIGMNAEAFVSARITPGAVEDANVPSVRAWDASWEFVPANIFNYAAADITIPHPNITEDQEITVAYAAMDTAGKLLTADSMRVTLPAGEGQTKFALQFPPELEEAMSAAKPDQLILLAVDATEAEAICPLEPVPMPVLSLDVAVAEAEMYTGQSGMDAYMLVPFVLSNNSGQTVELPYLAVDFVLEDGSIILSRSLTDFYPKVLGPGECAYGSIKQYLYNCGRQWEQLAMPRIVPVARLSKLTPARIPLTLEYNEIDDCCGVVRSLVSCTNPTGTSLYNQTAVVIYRDQACKLVDVVIQPYEDDLFPEEPVSLPALDDRNEFVVRYWGYHGESFDRIMEEGLGECSGFVCAADPWGILEPIVPEW